MSLESTKNELDEIIEKAKNEVLSLLNDDTHWDWLYSMKNDDNSIWITTKNKKYSILLENDGELTIRLGNYLILSEESPPKISKIFNFFKNKKSEPTPLAINIRKINDAITQRQNWEKMQNHLYWVKQAFKNEI